MRLSKLFAVSVKRLVVRNAAWMLVVAFAMQGCATNHLVRWSQEKSSTFSQPYEDYGPYVRPAGLILAMPVAVTWDVLTFPVQWLWGTYPYGNELRPDSSQSAMR